MPLDPYFTDTPRPRRQEAATAPGSGNGNTPAAAHAPHSPWPAAQQTAPDVLVEDIAIFGPHGPIPLRTYRPRGDLGAALLWAHGGGFRAGDLDMPEAHVVSGELAARARAWVVSVGYRLAADGVRYPVPIDDVHAAWKWLWAGGLPADLVRAPVALGGASAGAALALSTALRARDLGGRTPDALLLAYPFAHFPNPAPDDATAEALTEVPADRRIGSENVEDMVRNYVGRISDLPPDALPGGAPLTGLPPTSIVLSEYDTLRPSGELLERQLREVGVPVASYLARGMAHGHLNHRPDLPEMGSSLDFLADGLRWAGRLTP